MADDKSGVPLISAYDRGSVYGEHTTNDFGRKSVRTDGVSRGGIREKTDKKKSKQKGTDKNFRGWSLTFQI